MFVLALLVLAKASFIHVTIRIKCDGSGLYKTMQLFIQIV